MLLDATPTLEDIIVATLAQYPGCTVEELQERIQSKHRTFSISAIYQELRKLRARGVCAKVRNTYSLRLGWVLNIISLADQMYSQCMSEAGLLAALPAPGKKQIWTFRNMRLLGQFWTQLLLVLSSANSDKRCFEWAPLIWFSPGHAHEEAQLMRAMELAGIRYYVAIGSDTKVSREHAATLRKFSGEASFVRNPFAGDNRYISLTGNFMIIIDIPEGLHGKLKKFLEQDSRGTKDLMPQGSELFSEPSRLKLTLLHDTRAVRQQRKAFIDLFGL